MWRELAPNQRRNKSMITHNPKSTDRLFRIRRDIAENITTTNPEGHRIADAIGVVLNRPELLVWPGSTTAHHSYTGGLLQHIEEVLQLALSMSSAAPYLGFPSIHRASLIAAVVFHDFGKLWDYAPVLHQNIEDISDMTQPEWVRREILGWRSTSHSHLTHHVSRSNMEWVRIAARCEIDEETIEAVSHAILSHHGRREWGSPVAPATPLAWILHLADMASARWRECTDGV